MRRGVHGFVRGWVRVGWRLPGEGCEAAGVGVNGGWLVGWLVGDGYGKSEDGCKCVDRVC